MIKSTFSPRAQLTLKLLTVIILASVTVIFIMGLVVDEETPMSDYTIHEVEGDTPYVTMHGDFSMDDLQVILQEMRELYEREGALEDGNAKADWADFKRQADEIEKGEE
jgi:hypothetical protein